MTRGTRDESGVAQAAAPPQQGEARGNPYADQGGPRVSSQGLPQWLGPVVEAVRTVRPTQLSRFLPPRTVAAASPPC